MPRNDIPLDKLLGLSIVLIATPGCASRARESGSQPGLAASSALGATPFHGTLGSGKTTEFLDASDCTSLADTWLEAWCEKLMAYTPEMLPRSADAVPAFAEANDLEQTMDAAFAWSILLSDFSVCDIPAVAGYVAAGSRVENGGSTCRAKLGQAQKDGRFFITSPRSQANLWVEIPATPLLPTAPD